MIIRNCSPRPIVSPFLDIPSVFPDFPSPCPVQWPRRVNFSCKFWNWKFTSTCKITNWLEVKMQLQSSTVTCQLSIQVNQLVTAIFQPYMKPKTMQMSKLEVKNSNFSRLLSTVNCQFKNNSLWQVSLSTVCLSMCPMVCSKGLCKGFCQTVFDPPGPLYMSV